MSFGSFHMAEKRGVPLVTVSLYPVVASGEAEPMAFPRVPAWRWLRSFLSNQGSCAMSSIARPHLAAQREAMGSPRGRARTSSATRSASIPCFIYSEHVAARPSDWPDDARVTGHCTLDTQTGYRPPPELEAFSSAGGPPIYVGSAA